MVFEYKKRYLRSNLIFGLIWLLIFLLNILTKDDIHWLDYGYLLVASLYIGTFIYSRHYGYLTLENEILRLNDPRKKCINLNEVSRFKYFAGDYILESENKKLKINTHLLDAATLLELKTELAKYNLKPGFKRAVQVKTN